MIRPVLEFIGAVGWIGRRMEVELRDGRGMSKDLKWNRAWGMVLYIVFLVHWNWGISE